MIRCEVPETSRLLAGPPRFLPPPSPVRRDDGALSYEGACYAIPAGYRPLKLDLWVPSDATSGGGRPPLVVWIHGGAWLFGHRKELPPTLRPNEVFDELLAAGLAVASIDYRHSKEAAFPAQLHDAKAAIRYLRHFADQLGIDPDRIGIWGESAGGHLAALTALTAHRADLEGRLGVSAPPSRCDAAVIWYGVADVTRMPRLAPPPGLLDQLPPDQREEPIDVLLRGTGDAVRQCVSPVNHVHPDAPPFLLIHGDADRVVPIEQSRIMRDALLGAGVPVEFHVVPAADHIFDGYDDVPAIVATSTRFLADALRATPGSRTAPN